MLIHDEKNMKKYDERDLFVEYEISASFCVIFKYINESEIILSCFNFFSTIFFFHQSYLRHCMWAYRLLRQEKVI